MSAGPFPAFCRCLFQRSGLVVRALAAMGLVYWMARLWIKTSRGEMHDDPVVYAVKNRGSRLTVAAMVATVLAAHFVTLEFHP